MAKSKRVYQLAKELGVASKAVVEKCQAEGVPDIDNHMSVVKIGLEMTIRDWFSDAEAEAEGTSIERAQKVDLSRARKARRKRAKAAQSAGDEGEGGTATAVEEPPAEEESATGRVTATPRTTASPSELAQPAKARKKARTDTDGAEETEAETQEAPEQPAVTEQPQTPAVAAQAPAAEAPAEAPQAEESADQEQQQPAIAAEVQKVVEEPKSVGPMGQPNVPDRPNVIKPAGERLAKPKSVELKGPQVVRIEAPDVVERPRSRRQPDSNAPDGTVPGITRSRGPERGRGAGAPREGEVDTKPTKKRRSLSTRRGRSAPAEAIGRTKFTEADLAEQEARLNRSTGFVKRRRQQLKDKNRAGPIMETPVQTGGKVEIAEPIFIKDLSGATGIKSADIIKYLFTKKGVMANINSAIDAEAAMEVALEYDIELVVRERQTAEQQVVKEFEDREAVDVRPRPPVVTVLGHVDHGKTSLLDRIRKADVAAHESGGITQHIGAYRVTVQGHDQKEKTVVFLDTPGHEAFTKMRARGASVTDLAVLVVAADDGVMPQTIESINHAKAAGVPIIVALNKIDKQEATEENIRRIYGQLAEHGLNPVEWGGQTEVLKTSAEKNIGITELLEVLDYQAELLELKADFGGAARGTVIEAEMQEGRGPVARVLVQEGNLEVGNFIVIGRAFGRVRDITDDRGRSVKVVGPATPVEISGIDLVPAAGDHLYVTATLQKAEQVARHFREIEREVQLASQSKVTLDTFADKLKAGQVRELRVVLKADVQGSIETIRQSLEELGNDEVAVRVLHAAVGGVTETDVLLADASDAIVVGFHVIIPTAVRDIAEQRGVDVRLYRVIYELIEEVTKALEGMLEPETKEEELGTADVLQPFRVSKLGMVAGCMVSEGVVQRNAEARVVRNGVVVTDGRRIQSVRRVKDDVKEVRAGTECGVRIDGFDDVKEGDQIICYKTIKIPRKLK